MIILRLLHILGGVTWVGTVFSMVLFVGPATRAAGRAGDQVNQALGKQTKIGVVLPLATVLTLLSGLAMYMRDSCGLRPAWLATGAGITLTIGAVAALAAFFGPSIMVMVTQKQLAALGQEIGKTGGQPAAHQAAKLTALQSRVRSLNWLIAVLLAIAVTCMAIFRYV